MLSVLGKAKMTQKTGAFRNGAEAILYTKIHSLRRTLIANIIYKCYVNSKIEIQDHLPRTGRESAPFIWFRETITTIMLYKNCIVLNISKICSHGILKFILEVYGMSKV